MTGFDDLQQLEQRLATDPKSEEIKDSLRLVYALVADQMWEHAMSSGGQHFIKEAITWWSKLIQLEPCHLGETNIAAYFKLGLAHYLLGNKNEALSCAKVAQELQEKARKNSELAIHGISVLNTSQSAFTLLCNEAMSIEAILKLRQIGWLPRDRTILLAPPTASEANPLYEYVARDFCVITDSSIIRKLSQNTLIARENGLWVSLPHSEVLPLWEALVRINQFWNQKQLAPLFTLDDSQKNRGRDVLKGLGIQSDDWYITFHSGGNIQLYETALKAIHENDGWIISFDDSLKSIEWLSKKVVYWSDFTFQQSWLKLFFIASSKFFLGVPAPTGLSPSSFGVPVKDNCLESNC